MTKNIQTTCPYCGVGCGINAKVDDANRQIKISGDKFHPANFGRLCSKGSALGETIELKGRLLHPKVYGRETSWTEALDLVADSFKSVIEKYGADAVAFYGSGQLLTEDYYVANKLMKGFIGSANMDTNSRLCMSSSVAGHKRAFGADVVPNCYEDFEHAELILLIGSNAAWCHPVSFQRIQAAKEKNPNLKIVVIDPRKTASCDIADLHLSLTSGTDAILFNGLFQFLHEQNKLDLDFIENHTEGFEAVLECLKLENYSIENVARRCHLEIQDVKQFFNWFANTEKSLSLYSQGINQSSSGTDKVNTILNCHLATGRIGKIGCGAFSLTGQPNAMGGREVGGLAHQLAAHMDFSNPDEIDLVSRFWNAPNIAHKSGLPAIDLFDAIYDGKIKAVWIMGTNPVVSLPNADKVKEALKRCEFVVVSDCISKTDTTAFAHVLLPAQGWSEKDGTVTNSERRISRQRALLSPAGNAKPDWWILTQVARRLGFEQAFHYQSPVEIFREHAALSDFENNGERAFNISALAEISQHDYDNFQPTQWGITKATPNGIARFFADGKFVTKSGKAQLIPIIARLPVNVPDENYPLILNTGRIRDQWHTMTRTAIAAKLNQHKPEPFVEIHLKDAQRFELKTNQLAKIESCFGSMLARVQITDAQREGEIFVPMHWTQQQSTNGRMGALVNPIVDPISKQPESKHTPVKISAYQTAWQGFVLSRCELAIPKTEYWVKNKDDGFYRYELAGNQSLEKLANFARSCLCENENMASQWQEDADLTQGNYRAARFIDGCLESVFFITAENELPSRNWLMSLFAKNELTNAERLAVLTGIPPVSGEDVGAIVCACFNVGEKTIKERGLKTYQEVGVCLKAGTNCGSCLPEIKALLIS
ncbi:MAG: molybdopterin-dependent oxidoreductase [Methylococcales bacterium]|nr:molybdopterin-dependent oxidoreductase [Methylococcales bacterium]MDD5753483.1 molybdopterin-dependent oxidoreductase [Methylococcales bacterium]